jgi:glycosyltransferase involved in cell wall biosynthesis
MQEIRIAAAEAGLSVTLESELPAILPVGDGVTLLVVGRCSHPGKRIARLELTACGRRFPAIAHSMPLLEPGRGPDDVADGFWGALEFGARAEPASAEVGLEVMLDDGERARRSLGELSLATRLEAPSAAPVAAAGDGPLVAICMAAYEPPADLLERQLDSIRAQDHRRWLCLISDDCSTEDGHRRLLAAVEGDPRFVVSRSPRRLGFYRNFERALAMVPAEANYVALSDQDDWWRPEKLSTLVATIGDASLVYSDVRVVEKSGRVVSESYWSQRRNNSRNFASLLIANTVTGAASLFRRDLLDLALPFPPPFRKSYHDHWLASVALATGRIAYVDRPLHDYVQHDSAVLGHSAANFGMSPKRLADTRGARAKLDKIERSSRDSYFTLVLWLGELARTLELRTGRRLRPDRARVVRRLERFLRPPEPSLWLLLRSARGLVGLNETMYNELYLFGGIMWRRLMALWVRLGGRHR